MSEIEFWRSLALYLADCHAATAEGLGTRASKRERERHQMICQQAHDAISGGSCTANLSRYWDGRVDDWVVNRLREASTDPRYTITEAGIQALRESKEPSVAARYRDQEVAKKVGAVAEILRKGKRKTGGE